MVRPAKPCTSSDPRASGDMERQLVPSIQLKRLQERKPVHTLAVLTCSSISGSLADAVCSCSSTSLLFAHISLCRGEHTFLAEDGQGRCEGPWEAWAVGERRNELEGEISSNSRTSRRHIPHRQRLQITPWMPAHISS